MRQWKPIEHKEAYYRWELPARAWTKGRSLRGGQIKIVFEEGEWLGGAYMSGDDDGPRFLSLEEIETIRAEFGLDRYIAS